MEHRQTNDLSCEWCGYTIEDVDHILCKCGPAKATWDNVTLGHLKFTELLSPFGCRIISLRGVYGWADYLGMSSLLCAAGGFGNRGATIFSAKCLVFLTRCSS